jgi:hypothetical protein
MFKKSGPDCKYYKAEVWKMADIPDSEAEQSNRLPPEIKELGLYAKALDKSFAVFL